MTERTTITCPGCSATLAASESAAGKILLCPKCRTGIPVPQPEGTALAAITEQAAADLHGKQDRLTTGATVSRRQMWSNRSLVVNPMALVLAVLFTIGLMIWGIETFRTHRMAKAIKAAFRKDDFNQVLTLEPNHVEALIGRARQQLELPADNLEGAMRDLERLQRLVPDHPIHTEIQPTLSIARSMEHAEQGRIPAAIQELEESVRLGVEDTQLWQVRRTLIAALLEQANANLKGKRYDQALAECDQVLKLGGTILQVAPIASSVWEALGRQAATTDELDRAIHALEILAGARNSAVVADSLRQFRFRGSMLAYAEGDLDAAASHYLKLQVYGPLAADMHQFGETLTRSTIAVFQAEPLKKNLQRALQLIELLDDSGADSKEFVLLKISLASLVIAHSDPEVRNSHLEFVVRNITLARSRGISLYQHPKLVSTTALALADRGIERLQHDRIQEGSMDFRTAIAIYPEQTRLLLARLRKATLTKHWQLPADLLDQLRKNEQDDIWTAIPAEAIAFSVVRDTESYSEKIDRIAELMELPPPHLLDTYNDWYRIDAGRNRNGSLGWIRMPVAAQKKSSERAEGILFLIATSNFLQMIQPLDPLPDGNLHRVTMIDDRKGERKGWAAPLRAYGAFAFENDRKTLVDALNIDRDIRTELIPLGDWGADLDAYFVLTHQGLIHGLKGFAIPFQTPLFQLARSFIQEPGATAWFPWKPVLLQHPWVSQQLAVGLTVDPNNGIAVRSRLWLNPETDLGEVFSENPGGRELAVKHLPNAPFLIAVGGPISASQNSWIMSMLGVILSPQKAPNIQINSVEAGLVFPERVPAEAKDRAQNNGQVPYWGGLERFLIVIVSVENSSAALTELEALLAALAVQGGGPAAGNILGLGFFSRVSTQSSNLGDVKVLRLNVRDKGQDKVMMSIAAPDRENLVFTLGGDEELHRALAPFDGNANLSESATVRAAVRMLPEATSWLAVVDLQYATGFLLPGMWDLSVEDRTILVGDQPLPLALGMSWQKSELDIDLSLPTELLPFAGRILSLPQFKPYLDHFYGR